MNYVILFVIIISLLIFLSKTKKIIKAVDRVNLMYDYFILSGKASSERVENILVNIKERRPNPNDGSGCPKEEELMDG